MNQNQSDGLIFSTPNSTQTETPKSQTFVLDKKATIKANNWWDITSTSQILDISLARYLKDSGQKMESYYVETSEAELQKEGQNFLNIFSQKEVWLWQNVESPLTTVLAQMENTGVYVDKVKLEKTAAEMQKQVDFLEREIKEVLGQGLNINSPQQLGKALMEFGFKLKQTKSGNVSTDRQVLEDLIPEDKKGLIQNILDYRTVTKLLGTYTLNLIEQLDENSRIHCNFNQTQAATGRLSSANPNLQNIPIRNQEFGTAIRSCFCAPDDRLIVSADYSQIELRILAHLSQDKTLIDAFLKDEDIHCRTAAEMFGTPIEQITREQRALGKTMNFALVYQQGVFATSRMLSITQKEAKDFMSLYFERFPDAKPFVDKVLNKARECGYVESLFGRKRHFKNLNSKIYLLRQADERAAFNAVLQGSNADLIKIAMVEIYKQIQKLKIDAQTILQVHDELVFEVSKKDSQKLRAIVESVMTKPPIELLVPIKVDIHIGQSWVKG
jgi:DNA polymerase I